MLHPLLEEIVGFLDLLAVPVAPMTAGAAPVPVQYDTHNLVAKVLAERIRLRKAYDDYQTVRHALAGEVKDSGKSVNSANLDAAFAAKYGYAELDAGKRIHATMQELDMAFEFLQSLRS